MGIAAYLAPSQVLGVDLKLYINESENSATSIRFGFRDEKLRDKIEFKAIEPAENLGRECFDLVLSWSVIEHVDRRIFDRQVQRIYECLTPSGLAVLQSAPLYYSPYGSHVYDLPPWSHLFMSESEFQEALMLNSTKDRFESLLSCKNTLNRLTSKEMQESFVRAGFELLDLYTTSTPLIAPASLLERFNANILLEEQAVWVLRKN
jgi:cyclopropane fatty-acyl-phospholipid synthase-like methyltransferase